ncbi:MAG: DUF420 domain-containing protein [Chitinophagales bacterium]|nr:DUF420 domain-containing protein [Chitinophagales bacterium]MDW8428580.1 DUF420 domain-containing protein [Chitinophagales bacterium]
MNERNARYLIIAVSGLIPVLVVLLIYLKPAGVALGFDVRLLPALNATLNSMTAVLLVTGYVMIRKGRRHTHQLCMVAAVVLSALFLISYVIYHWLTEPTPFGGSGWIRPVYYFILISHVVLAAGIVPLVLFTLFYATQQRFDRHRRLARITFPLWLYVAVSGVAVYLLLRPYY